MIGEMAEQPAADRTHDEAEREQDRGVQLLDDRIGARKERAGEIEREGGVGVEVVPLDQIADRPDEDRRQPAAHVGELELSFLHLRHDSAFSAARYLRTRAALAPISPPPTRDSDRTSTRQPFGLRLHPHDDVVFEAEPECRVGRFDAPAGGIGRDEIPSHGPRRGERPVEGAGGRQVQRQRNDIRIGRSLLRRDVRPAVLGRIQRALAQAQHGPTNGGGLIVSVVMS